MRDQVNQDRVLGGRMRRLAAICGLCAWVGACSTVPAQPDDLCAVFYENDAWFGAAVATEQRWAVPIPAKMAIIRHESGYSHDAKAPRHYALGFIPWGRTSSAYGYAQAVDGTWERYQRETGNWRADRDDFADASDFVGWYMSTSLREIGLSLDDVYSHYLAYHEGHGGFRRGTYKSKAWLIDYADRVAATARVYRAQLANCRTELENRGPWWWPFG